MLHFDNLSATIIGGIVLLTVLFMQERQRDVSIDKVVSYAANKHSIELGSWLQEDMTNIGWQTPPSDNGLDSLATNDSIPELSKTFAFDGLHPHPDSTHLSALITYQLVPAMTPNGQDYAEINGNSVPLWELQRVVNGIVMGASVPLITHFSVEPLTTAGIPTTIDVARTLRIKFSMALSRDEAFIQEVHWGTTFSIWRL